MKMMKSGNLRFVVFSRDIIGDEPQELHVCKYDYRNHRVTATACGIGGVKEAYAFPLFRRLWLKSTTPVCEACYAEVNHKIRW